MSDSNCNCCICQYSTPPWWVTMGFNPTYTGITPIHTTPPVTSAPSTPTHNSGLLTGIGNAVTGASSPPHNSGGLGGALGGLLNPIINPIGTVGNVVSDIVDGIGNVLGGIF